MGSCPDLVMENGHVAACSRKFADASHQLNAGCRMKKLRRHAQVVKPGGLPTRGLSPECSRKFADASHQLNAGCRPHYKYNKKARWKYKYFLWLFSRTLLAWLVAFTITPIRW